MIEEFVAYLKTERRYSPHTLSAYHSDLLQFLNFLSVTFDLDDTLLASSIMVRSWMVELSDNDVSAKSINRKLSSLKSFYQYQRKLGRLEVSPTANLSGPKIPKRLPQFLKVKETENLTSAALFDDDWIGLRDRLLITMMYECGLRRAEVIELEWKSLDQAKCQVKVLGKGSKERIIPYKNDLNDLIEAYRLQMVSEKVESNDLVFMSNRGKKLYPKAVYNIVVKYVSLVSSQSYKGPHLLRHSFATHLTNEGAEIKAIQDLLGHSSLAATQVYTHNSIEKLKRAYKSAHPKA